MSKVFPFCNKRSCLPNPNGSLFIYPAQTSADVLWKGVGTGSKSLVELSEKEFLSDDADQLIPKLIACN